jgi:hypothetical protein
MTLKIDTKDRAYYNLRKRYGFKKAREIIGFWNHFHIEGPGCADEALLYFVGVAR